MLPVPVSILFIVRLCSTASQVLRSKSRLGCNRGLTLIELMSVVAIIGVLCAIAIPAYNNYVTTSRYAAAIESLRRIDSDCQAFNLMNKRYPDSLAEIGVDNARDPWGNPYAYLNIQTTANQGKVRKDRGMKPVNSDFDLYSMGPDGDTKTPFTAKQSQDDIVRASDGKYYGWAKDF